MNQVGARIVTPAPRLATPAPSSRQSMHIGIDATCWHQGRGYGRHARSLITALLEADRENRYTLIARPEDLDQIRGLGPNFQAAAYGRPDTDALHNLAFPYFLRPFRADLYHIPLNSVAWWMPRPYVVTIHDMSTLLFPARHDIRHTLHEER